MRENILENMLENMIWVWLAVVACSAAVEAATMALVSVWFALGALAAVFAAYLGADLAAQMTVFILVSLAALAAARPLARRFVDPHIVPTNADRLLGTAARVLEDIDNDTRSGAVFADGTTWTARSADGEVIPAGATVEIVRMEGVKLLVRSQAAVSVLS